MHINKKHFKLIILLFTEQLSLCAPRFQISSMGRPDTAQTARDSFNYINNNLDTLVAGDINNLVQEVSFWTKEPVSVFSKLMQRIVDQTEYHAWGKAGKKFHKSDVQMWTFWGCFSCATGALYYYAHNKYKKNASDFDLLIQGLAAIKVFIREEKTNWSMGNHHYSQTNFIISKPRDLSTDQQNYVQNTGQRLVELYKSKERYASFSFWSGLCSALSGALVLYSALNTLILTSPSWHKKRHDRFIWALQTLDQCMRKENLKLKPDFKNLLLTNYILDKNNS